MGRRTNEPLLRVGGLHEGGGVHGGMRKRWSNVLAYPNPRPVSPMAMSCGTDMEEQSPVLHCLVATLGAWSLSEGTWRELMGVM